MNKRDMKEPRQSSLPIHCGHCIHYYVTWDPKFPYGCRAIGFKSEKSPALVVYESSGMECQLFAPKEKGYIG